MSELKPCPFCGGTEVLVRENGRIWTGRKYGDPVSVSIMHWCPAEPGQPSRALERAGRDRASAVAAWNRRDPGATQPKTTTPAKAQESSETVVPRGGIEPPTP
jgi:hypothetical protein